MKKLLSKISLLKIITLILVICLVATFVSKLPEYVLKSTPVSQVLQEGIPECGEVISKAIEGNVLVAKNGGKSLYVSPKSLNVTVVDDATGMTWKSMPQDGNITEKEQAPLFISFLDATGAVSNWDVYTYCIANDNTTRELEEGESYTDTYSINTIENGFRATLKVSELESAVLNEYMPKQISVERYTECFLNKIDSLLEDGKINEDQKIKYNKALSMIYALDEENQEYYYNKYAGTPPVTVTTILIDLAKKVQYTTEDLLNDSREFNIMDVEISHPADFQIIMDVTLENGDLVVHVPTYEILNNSEDQEYYTLQKITIFPNFSLADAKKYNDGFIFVPDGSGALFNLNSYDSGYVEYSRSVYNNDYYDTLYSDTEYNEDLMMPVFGLGKKNAEFVVNEAEESEETPEEAVEATEEVTEPEKEDDGSVEIKTEVKDADMNGFLAIIESGAETASITVNLGVSDTSNGGTNFNKVYASFDVMQYSNVKVFGPYSTNEAKFLAKSGSFDVDLKIRYKLYTENCNYYTMAQDYKNYIIAKNNLTAENALAPEIFLDVVSSLTVEDRFMGVPYDRTISMTTYSELEEIMDDLEGVDKVVSYKGAYNGGIYNTINTDAKRTKSNGSKSEYESLMKKYGDSIYMSTAVSNVYKDTAIFNEDKHGLLGYDSEAVKVYDYDIPTGRFNHHGEGHYILSPYYLPGVVESFTKGLGNVNLAVEDLGNLVYAQYDPDTEVNLYEGEQIIANALATLSANDRNLVLYNPFATRMLYADYSADISRESSDYGLIAHNVPFRQIVMNGLTKYTTLDVNESSSGTAYYLLQALELGSCPKYKITYKSVDRLKENNYSELYSTEYKLLAESIKNMSATIKSEFAKIGTTEIVGHEILDEKVYVTTYATGVKVVTNYNTYEVTTPYGNVSGFGYKVVEAGEEIVETEAEAEAEAEVVIEEGGEVNE
ncbi:MAG: DUF5696 domain-containing protein [Clostridia bacterium]